MVMPFLAAGPQAGSQATLGTDEIGSLEVGKDADIVIWTAEPLTTIGGRAWMTIIDGKIVCDKLD